MNFTQIQQPGILQDRLKSHQADLPPASQTDSRCKFFGNRHTKLAVIFLVVAASFAGCVFPPAGSRARQTIALPAVSENPPVPTKHQLCDFENLSKVLKCALDSDRDILPAKLEKNLTPLLNQLRIFQHAGPGSTPEYFETDWQKTAYWLNARAAWSIYVAYLQSKKPADGRTCDFSNLEFLLDGKMRTFADIDRKLEQTGGLFAVLCAPGVTSHRARLPGKPFSGENLHQRLEKRFCKFISDPKKIIIDVDNQTVEFPPVIWKFRDRLIAKYQHDFGAKNVTLTTALLRYVKGAAQNKLQNAIGYKCRQNDKPVKLLICED